MGVIYWKQRTREIKIFSGNTQSSKLLEEFKYIGSPMVYVDRKYIYIAVTMDYNTKNIKREIIFQRLFKINVCYIIIIIYFLTSKTH